MTTTTPTPTRLRKRGATNEQKTFLAELVTRRPELMSVVGWLKAHDANPEPMLAGASAKLSKRERHLPQPQRDKYFAVVLFNEFLTRWVRHNRGKTVSNWIQDHETIDQDGYENELKPFELVVTLLCDADAFKKEVPKLIRESEAKRINFITATAMVSQAMRPTTPGRWQTACSRTSIQTEETLPEAQSDTCSKQR